MERKTKCQCRVLTEDKLDEIRAQLEHLSRVSILNTCTRMGSIKRDHENWHKITGTMALKITAVHSLYLEVFYISGEQL
jgi:hypothetical protein